MENSNDQTQKMNALDFFLHLGAIVSLYIVIGNFISLLFKIINTTYPEVGRMIYWYSGSGSQISLPVATLIIVFPIFILLSSFIYKSYSENEYKKYLGIRKWLTYITLFIAGIILAGDLVTILYKFLDGQDLTNAFLFKALVILLVSGAVFSYYLCDIKDRISSKKRRIWLVVIICIIVASIILGFNTIGSPRKQRLLREDDQKIQELINLDWQIINYWQVNGELPEEMPRISSPSKDIKYKRTGKATYEFCADFNLETQNQYGYGMYQRTPTMMDKKQIQNNWEHKAGYHCFQKEIDPVAYPTQVRG